MHYVFPCIKVVARLTTSPDDTNRRNLISYTHSGAQSKGGGGGVQSGYVPIFGPLREKKRGHFAENVDFCFPPPYLNPDCIPACIVKAGARFEEIALRC